MVPAEQVDWRQHRLTRQEARWKPEVREEKEAGYGSLVIWRVLLTKYVILELGWCVGLWSRGFIVLMRIALLLVATFRWLCQPGPERVSSAGTIELLALKVWTYMSPKATEPRTTEEASALRQLFSEVILALRCLWFCIKLWLRMVRGVYHAIVWPVVRGVYHAIVWPVVRGVYHAITWLVNYLWPAPAHTEVLWRRLHDQVRGLDNCCVFISSSALSGDTVSSTRSALGRNYVDHVFNHRYEPTDLSDAVAGTALLYEKFSQIQIINQPYGFTLFSAIVSAVEEKLSVLHDDHGLGQEFDKPLQEAIELVRKLQEIIRQLAKLPAGVRQVKKEQVSSWPTSSASLQRRISLSKGRYDMRSRARSVCSQSIKRVAIFAPSLFSSIKDQLWTWQSALLSTRTRLAQATLKTASAVLNWLDVLDDGIVAPKISRPADPLESAHPGIVYGPPDTLPPSPGVTYGVSRYSSSPRTGEDEHLIDIAAATVARAAAQPTPRQLRWKPIWNVSLDRPIPVRNEANVPLPTQPPTPLHDSAPEPTLPPSTLGSAVSSTSAGLTPMLTRWSTRVSDLCQACFDLWQRSNDDVGSLDVTKLQVLEREAAAVEDLMKRVHWTMTGHHASECIAGLHELELLVCIQQLNEMLDRDHATPHHVRGLKVTKALSIAQAHSVKNLRNISETLLKGLKHVCNHPRKRKNDTSKSMTEGWMLGKLQLVQTEVNQWVRRRLNITDSIYLLGPAYTTERLVKEFGKVRMRLLPLVAQARAISLGTDNLSVLQAVKDIENAVSAEGAAMETITERADFTMSLNESADGLASDMLQDTNMSGMSPATPKPVFSESRASYQYISTLRKGLARTATQVNYLTLPEAFDCRHAAEMVEAGIRHLISNISTAVDYNDARSRAVVDEVFDAANTQLLTLKNITFGLPEPPEPDDMDIEHATPVQSPEELSDRWSLPSTPVTPGPAKKKTRHVIRKVGRQKEPLRNANPIPLPIFKALALSLGDLERGLDAIKAKLSLLASRHLEWASQAHSPVPASAEDLLKDLEEANAGRHDLERLLYKLRLERRKATQEGVSQEHLASFRDVEDVANNALSTLAECMSNIGNQMSLMKRHVDTLREARLRASVSCFLELRTGLHGRYNNLTQLEDPVGQTSTNLSKVNSKACGEQTEFELNNVRTVMVQLEYLRAGSEQMLEDPGIPLSVPRLQQVLHQGSELTAQAGELWTILEERRKHGWYVEGPSYAILNLRDMGERNVLPSITDNDDGFDGARALLMSLQTVLANHHDSMIDGRILGVDDIGEILRDMFSDFDDKAARDPLPTSAPDNSMQPTLAYHEFLRSHLGAVEHRYGRESNTYRQQWDEARSFNHWKATQLHIMLCWLQSSGRVPPTSFRLGVITRNGADVDSNTRATVEVFGTISNSQESEIIVWIYNDNAANIWHGRSSQWFGFEWMAEPTSDAMAIRSSWFEGSTLPSPQRSVVPRQARNDERAADRETHNAPQQPEQAHNDWGGQAVDHTTDLNSRLNELTRLWPSLQMNASGPAIQAEIDKLDDWYQQLGDILQAVRETIRVDTAAGVDVSVPRGMAAKLTGFLGSNRHMHDTFSTRMVREAQDQSGGDKPGGERGGRNRARERPRGADSGNHGADQAQEGRPGRGQRGRAQVAREARGGRDANDGTGQAEGKAGKGRRGRNRARNGREGGGRTFNEGAGQSQGEAPVGPGSGRGAQRAGRRGRRGGERGAGQAGGGAPDRGRGGGRSDLRATQTTHGAVTRGHGGGRGARGRGRGRGDSNNAGRSGAPKESAAPALFARTVGHVLEHIS